MIEHVSTNSDGKFTFVPEEKLPIGFYSVIARSIAPSGMYSGYMSPIQIEVKEPKLNVFVSIFNSYMILLIPFIALIILFILIVLYGYNRIKKFNENLNKKIINTENIISKDFQTLKKDIEREAITSSKLKDNEKLSPDEMTTLVDLKDDIKKTEKDILENIKNIQV